MALRTIAGTLILLLTLFHPADAARDLGISKEVIEVLAETRFERSPSIAQRRDLVARLQRRGIETPTDLHPYLGQSERVRHNALYAMEQMGGIDAKTLALIEDLARETAGSSAPSAATAVRLVLEQSEWPAVLDFARAIARKNAGKPHLVLMTWLSAQDQSLFGTSKGATDLTKACLSRLIPLFETGTYSGRLPLSFSVVAQRPPFNDTVYVEEVTAAFLSAIENAGRMKDMRKLGFISSFSAVAQGAERAPKLVEEGLVHIVTTGSHPLRKLVLWRMSIDGLASTQSGERIVQVALKKSPGLAGYLDRLRNVNQGVAGTDHILKNEIEDALKNLNRTHGVPPVAGTQVP